MARLGTLQCRDSLIAARAEEGYVALAAGHLTFQLPAVPTASPALGAEFRLGTGNNRKGLPILFPAGSGQVPPYQRFAVYMTLTRDDGSSAGDLGQLVLTDDRLIGMMTRGSADGTRLDERAGSVYVFTVARGDLAPAVRKTRWTGRAAGVVVRSAAGLEPGFVLEITSAIGTLADDGRLTIQPALASLLDALASGH
jgi:hypothetical protein